MTRAAALVVALLAAGLAGCGGGGTDPWTLHVSGSVRLVRDGDIRRLETGEHKVEADDRIEVVQGVARLTLPDDASLELREGVGTADDSALRVADLPELLDGEMLLLGADDGASAVAGAATIGIADGAVRVRRGASVTVGVYEGTPTLEANGRTLEDLRALRQATVTDSGALPRALQPVSYDTDAPDPWDVRFLGDAIDLDEQIERRRLSITQNAERSDLVPVVLALAGDVPVDQDRSIGETVVGAAIARAGADGDVADRWRAVFSFRDDGAPWGVVALDQRADRGAVLVSLDDVVRRLVQRFGGVAAGEGGGGGGPVALPGLSGDGTDDGSSQPPSGGGGGGGSTPPPTAPPGTGPAPTVPPPALPPLLPLLPLLPLPDLPGVVDDDPDDPVTPGPDISDDDTLVDELVDEVVDVVEETPVIGDVLGDLLDGPPDPVGPLAEPPTGVLGGHGPSAHAPASSRTIRGWPTNAR